MNQKDTPQSYDLEDLTSLHRVMSKTHEKWVREQIRNVAECVFYDLFGITEKEDRVEEDKKNEQFIQDLVGLPQVKDGKVVPMTNSPF